MAGDAPRFAAFGGIRPRPALLRAMLISGALAGLAGAIEVIGVHYRFVSTFSGGDGFDGVAVAVLGHAHPLGVVIASLVLAGLRLGATNGLQMRVDVPRELGGAMIALILLLASSDQLYAEVVARLQGWIDLRRINRKHVEERKETEAA
jgi:simple sugar transport system permease protein